MNTGHDSATCVQCEQEHQMRVEEAAAYEYARQALAEDMSKTLREELIARYPLPESQRQTTEGKP